MNNKILRRLKIRKKIRKKINGTFLIPRLSIYKSNKTIYAQLIDDEAGKTIASACSLKLKGKYYLYFHGMTKKTRKIDLICDYITTNQKYFEF